MYLTIKRIFDISGAAFGLLVMSPVLLFIAIWIRMTMGAPILFRQKRPGLHGKPFEMLKFRTMTNERDDNGELLPDEKRLTRLGRFLRKTSLDEFPEFINVLKGDMSLVGPRPLLMQYLPYYTEREKKRHNVRPGITGLSQVSGRNFLPWDERLEMDVKYVETLSLWCDIVIIWKTALQVLVRKDVAVTPALIGKRLDHERQRG